MIRVLSVAALLALTGCTSTPVVVREPYEVEKRVEVVKPIPQEWTVPLVVPQLPDRALVWRDSMSAYLQCKAVVEKANEDRADVAVFSGGETE